jgi:hypothetical protein
VSEVTNFLSQYGFSIRDINKEWVDAKISKGIRYEAQKIKISKEFNTHGDFILLGRTEFPIRVLSGIFISKKSINESKETKFIVVLDKKNIAQSKVYKMNVIRSCLGTLARLGGNLPKRFGKDGIYLSRMKNFVSLEQFAVNMVKIKVTCVGDRQDYKKINLINQDFNKTKPRVFSELLKQVKSKK